MKRLRSVPLLACVAACGALLAPVFAAAADPVPFATVSGTCPSNGYGTFYGPPVTSSHPDVVVRYTATAGQGSLDGRQVGAGDVVWGDGWSLSTNSTPDVYCSTDYGSTAMPFTATFYDVSAAPTTYSGVGNTGGSTLPFKVAGETQYVADLSLSGGAVELRTDYYRWQNFASSGQFSLGTLSPGIRELRVEALDGGRPNWTVTIRPLPVAISDLKFESPIVRPGPTFDATYTSSGETNINAVVRDSTGNVVRGLATGARVTSGERSLTWDGRNDSGQMLADGTYRLTVGSHDLNGLSSSATADVTLDGTAPDLRVTTPATIAPDQPVTVAVADALSGVSDASITGDSYYDRVSLQEGQTSMSYRPAGGWSEGRHELRLFAEDGSGNERAFDYTVTVARPAPPTSASSGSLTCSKSAAKRAVRRSRVFEGFARRFVGTSVLDTWSVYKVFCRDLTGDGRRDMGAYLLCCTVSSPRLMVIFRGTTDGWRVAFKSSRRAIWDPKLSGRTIVFKQPVYRRSDANCCPSRLRRYKIVYRGGTFRVQRRR